MAVINLGPSRASRIGTNIGRSLGQGFSSSLEQKLQEERERRFRKQRIQKQYKDLQSLQEVLQQGKQGAQEVEPGTGQKPNQRATLMNTLQQYQPQTKTGLELMSQVVGRQFEKPESYTLRPGEVRYQGGLPVAWGMPERDWERVKVTAYKDGKEYPLRIPKRGYNQNIQRLRKKGYTFDEPEDSKVSLYNPDTGRTIKTRRGSEKYKRLVENKSFQEGTPDIDQGEWFTKAEEQLGRFYGKLTDSGVVINPQKADEYDRASTLLESYRQQGMDPYKAASQARRDAKTFYDKLESIPRLSGTWGGLSQGNTQKVHKNIGDLLQSGYDTREIRDFLVQERGWPENDAIEAMKTAYEEYVAE